MDNRIIEQFNKRAPFTLEDATVVVLALIGSHSHGTYIPPTDPQAIDDIDYMGIVIPPIGFTLGLKEWEGLNFQFEELDCVFYSFRKFLGLLVKSNPNVLGMMWLRPEHYIVKTPEWDMLLKSRDLFSSKMAYNSFMGYAYSQLTKMTNFDIETQTKWEDAVELVVAAGWSVESVTNPNSKSAPMPNFKAINNLLQVDFNTDEINNVLNDAKNTIIKIHARHFQGYMGEKRKSLVKKYGYDTKNAAHLIRLMRMCVEFLESGELKVFRDVDGDHIKAIKRGEFSIEQVREEAESLFALAKTIKNTMCTLPDEPNISAINGLTVHCYLSAYNLKLSAK